VGRSKGKILSSQRKYLVSQAKQVNIMNTHYLVASFVLRQFFTHRLSIARAVYQNSSILIMDETTSALDIRSELLLKRSTEESSDKPYSNCKLFLFMFYLIMHFIVNILLSGFLVVTECRYSSLLIDRKWC